MPERSGTEPPGGVGARADILAEPLGRGTATGGAAAGGLGGVGLSPAEAGAEASLTGSSAAGLLASATVGSLSAH